MVIVLALITVAEQLERSAGSVLAPDIQDTLHISDTTLIGISAFGGVALGARCDPAGVARRPRLARADRLDRDHRLGGRDGAQRAHREPVPAVLHPRRRRVRPGVLGARVRVAAHRHLSDPGPRPRLLALLDRAADRLAARAVRRRRDRRPAWVAPKVGGGRTSCSRSRRCSSRSSRSSFLREPARGRYEQELVLGEVITPSEARVELPVTMSTAYARMKKIKTFYFICVGIGVLGLRARRGSRFSSVCCSTTATATTRTRAVGCCRSRRSRRWSRSPSPASRTTACSARIPSASCVWRASFIIGYGVLMLIALRMKEPALLLIGVALAGGCTSAAFVSVGPIVGAVAPYRMRTQAFALIPVFIFLMGGFFGGIIAGALSDAHGERTALSIVAPLAGAIGGALFIYGSRYLKRDISLAVEELIEEQSELQRMSAHPDDIPVLQIHNLDFSYGPVQVLFDVGLEVTRGEVLALLGTNGAGKSTLLRAISGLGHPRPRRRPPQRAHAHVRRRRGALPPGDRAAARRRGRLPRADASARTCTRRCSRPRSPAPSGRTRIDGVLATFPALANRRAGARPRPLRRPAADARPRHGAGARTRDPAHRRALARSRAARRRGAPRGRAGAEGTRARR